MTKALYAAAAAITLAAILPAADSAYAQLQADVQQLRYGDLERDLARMPAGPERDLFTGILDNREWKTADSVRLLEATLSDAERRFPAIAGVALESLADDYVKSGRYADASREYQELLAKYASGIPAGELQDVKDDLATFQLLAGAPPQTIEFTGAVDLPIHKSPLGSFDADLTVNGVTAPWLLDTGANLSVLSASFAKKLGLQPSTGTAQTKGSSGAENLLRTALLPELPIGGAVLRNVPVMIFEDKNLQIPTGARRKYQINAILGLPVFQALGRVAFIQQRRFVAGAQAPEQGRPSRLFMYKLTPLLECGVHGKQRLFSFDTGASSSIFFVPYYREFSIDFVHKNTGRSRLAGAGGEKTLRSFVLDTATLTVAGNSAALHDVSVFPKPLGGGSDDLYGNLGRDLVAPYPSFTLDFRQMQFYLGWTVD